MDYPLLAGRTPPVRQDDGASVPELTPPIDPDPTGIQLGVCPGRRGRPKYLSKLRYWKTVLQDWNDWRTGAWDLTRRRGRRIIIVIIVIIIVITIVIRPANSSMA